MYQPYTDITLYPTFDISTVPNVKFFSLGFIVADEDKNPSWGGYYSIDSDFYKDIIRKVREKGGDVLVSFGGTAGSELATVMVSPDELYKKYKWVIEEYCLKSIDFDIEGSAVSNQQANSNRDYAVKKLKETFPDLVVSVTLPVSPTGLSAECLEIAKSIPCDIVNIMAMDYGNESDMGAAAISAAKATYQQTGKPIGITVMIGKNDTVEVFTLDNARAVKQFQVATHWVKRLSIWCIERDKSWASQVYQQPYEFSEIFNKS